MTYLGGFQIIIIFSLLARSKGQIEAVAGRRGGSLVTELTVRRSGQVSRERRLPYCLVARRSTVGSWPELRESVLGEIGLETVHKGTSS